MSTQSLNKPLPDIDEMFIYMSQTDDLRRYYGVDEGKVIQTKDKFLLMQYERILCNIECGCHDKAKEFIRKFKIKY